MYINLIKKELKHYFNSLIAYVFLVAFFSISGWFFIFPFFINNQASLNVFFSSIPLILVFFAPALSMRLFAEEKKQGTIETLLTLPISETQIVLSKFLSSVIFMGITLIGSFLYAYIASRLGNLEWGVVFSSYIGALLLSASMISYGMFISSITKNQIISFIISSIISLVLVITGIYGNHYDSFLKGVIDANDVVFFLSIIIIMIIITRENIIYRKI